MTYKLNSLVTSGQSVRQKIAFYWAPPERALAAVATNKRAIKNYKRAIKRAIFDAIFSAHVPMSHKTEFVITKSRTRNVTHFMRGDAFDLNIWLFFLVQPCSDSSDFREQQCSAYNDVPYEGLLFKWAVHHDEMEPCSLSCKTRSKDGRSTLVVQLAPKVQDGTRCRHGSLDMCISGKCQVSTLSQGK